MYSTCLFCNTALGRNEVIERFPVGRRLAFDAAKGRLWVVCTACRRWNLTPLEERWEAIEECERRFRDTRLRVSTGQIGLARLREGLELVRVGEPQRPEIAAWRYGDRFFARRRQHRVTVGTIVVASGVGGIVAFGGMAVGGAVAGMFGAYAAKMAISTLWQRSTAPLSNPVAMQLRGDTGETMPIRLADLAGSRLDVGADGGIAFELVHASRLVRVEGERARAAARQLLPAINRRGGTAEDVGRAVERLEHAGDAERFLANAARRGRRLTPIGRNYEPGAKEFNEMQHGNSGLLALSTSLGLAMEMALNEEEERRVLEGELAELEAAWREAEEIGAIADALLLPEPVERALRLLKLRPA